MSTYRIVELLVILYIKKIYDTFAFQFDYDYDVNFPHFGENGNVKGIAVGNLILDLEINMTTLRAKLQQFIFSVGYDLIST